MTPEAWQTCADPTLMLQQLGHAASARKLRLYACAWGYRAWPHMHNECSREAVIVAERFADGLADLPELAAAYRAAHAVWKDLHATWGRGSKRLVRGKWAERRAASVARQAANPTWGLFAAQHARGNAVTNYALAGFLRDIFGDPFHLPALDPACLFWNGGTVPKLAQAIYDENDFTDLPILADALEESGCADENILRHCRQAGEHVRGCFAVDLCLGRE